MQESHFEKQQKQPLGGRFHRHKWVLPTAFSLFLTLFIGAFAWLLYTHSNQPLTRPAQIPWEIQPDQVVAQCSGTLFKIKYISITPQELRFFYVARSPHRGSVHVEATSLSPKGNSTPLVASGQPLGQLGAWDAGVIHVQQFLLTGQTIELRITPSGETEPVWILAPLKQPFPEPHPNSWTGLSIQSQQSREEVLWIGPERQELVALFQLNEAQSKPDTIFIRLDDAIKVNVITEKEYKEILAKENKP